jgi:hypothetical protein
MKVEDDKPVPAVKSSENPSTGALLGIGSAPEFLSPAAPAPDPIKTQGSGDGKHGAGQKAGPAHIGRMARL